MNKKCLLAIATCTLMFAACGDDVTEVTEVNEIHQEGIAVLDAGLELSKQKCGAENAGEMLFVTDSAMVFVCDGGTWVSLKGADGDDGEGCEISREGNVLTITCGKSIETVDLDELIQTSSSSSSVIASSSGAKQSSSSEAVAEVKSAGYYKTNCPAGYTCKDAASTDYLNSGITYGEILDIRDGYVYKVVTIGAQTWMAQNLNFEIGGICYGGAPDNCDTYGRLYIWYVARNACPAGWHLPSTSEWEALFRNVGGRDVAGSKLKSKNGWNGEDSYGFAVLPAGGQDYDGDFFNVGNRALFWSSTEYDGYDAYYENFRYYDSDVGEGNYDKYDALSVRCLRN